MKIIFSKQIFISLFIIFASKFAVGQDQQMIDRVVATVGDKIILQSDIENQVLQLQAQGYTASKDANCDVLEELLVQKLLINQAELDTLVVGFNRVESELERRLMYFVRQIGGEKKLEEYYSKSMLEIKEDFRPLIYDQLLTQMMQSKLVSEASVSPKDVERFYKKLPKDSIPLVNKQIEINQIVIYPPANEDARLEARKKLLELRDRVLKGERFSTLAVLYSEDPGSARRGGELGLTSKDELDPAFAKAAFSLRDGEVSKIVESAFGFHIIQMIGKEGNQANVRHILITPKLTPHQEEFAINKLDSISKLIRNDSLDFRMAAFKFTEDEQGKLNEGIMVNQMSSTIGFELEELPKEVYNAIQSLKPGEISAPFASKDNDGKTVFKIIRIKREIEAHRANLKDDYERIEKMALFEIQNGIIKKWVDAQKMKTYIHIDDSFMDCQFLKDGWIK